MFWPGEFTMTDLTKQIIEKLKQEPGLLPKDWRFTPGPSLIPKPFVEDLLSKSQDVLGISHRSAAAKNQVTHVQEMCKQYFEVPDDYVVCIHNGGATMFFDLIACSLVREKIAHFTCGEFSNKWHSASKNVPWIKCLSESVDFGQGIDPRPLEDADVICCTHNETSTGAMISSFEGLLSSRASDDSPLICVDATSIAGAIKVPWSLIDVMFFSPQKALASEGGMVIAILSPKAQERARQVASQGSRYIPKFFDLPALIDASLKNQTPTTPSMTTLFFLQKQFEQLLNEGGISKIEEVTRQKANILYDWAKERQGLEAYIKEEKYRSISVLTIDVDEKYCEVGPVLKELEAQKIACGIGSYRKLGRNQVRIANFPAITISDMQALTRVLDRCFNLEE